MSRSQPCSSTTRLCHESCWYACCRIRSFWRRAGQANMKRGSGRSARAGASRKSHSQDPSGPIGQFHARTFCHHFAHHFEALEGHHKPGHAALHVVLHCLLGCCHSVDWLDFDCGMASSAAISEMRWFHIQCVCCMPWPSNTVNALILH